MAQYDPYGNAPNGAPAPGQGATGNPNQQQNAYERQDRWTREAQELSATGQRAQSAYTQQPTQQLSGGAPQQARQTQWAPQPTQQIPSAQQQAYRQQAYQQQAQQQQAQQPYGQHSTSQMPPVFDGPKNAAKPPKQKKPASRGAVFAVGIVAALLGAAVGGGATYYAVSSQLGVAPAVPEAIQEVLPESTEKTNVTINAAAYETSLSEAVVAKSLPSVVSVYVYAQDYGYFMGGGGEEVLYATGSGVIISEDGYIVTNEHVVEDASRVTVIIDGAEVDAQIVGTDASSDIAVLKVAQSGLTAIEVGDSDAVSVGEWCMTMGSPYGLDQSCSSGIVSAKFRSTALESTTGVAIYANLIQTDAAINSGSSGGALVNAEGKLIGITTLTTASGSAIGFAIPVNYAMDIAQQIIDTGEAHHAYLGLAMASVTSSMAEQYGIQADSGVYVTSVVPGLAADSAGLQAGDVITKVDDTPITTASGLIMAIRTYSIGDTVTITYIRDGAEQTCEATLSSDAGQDVAGSTSNSSGSNRYGDGGGQGDNGYGGGHGGM